MLLFDIKFYENLEEGCW